MERFYEYVIENYTLSGEAKRMLDSIVQYVGYQSDFLNEDCSLSDVGVDFLESIVAGNIGMERQEIIDNWR